MYVPIRSPDEPVEGEAALLEVVDEDYELHWRITDAETPPWNDTRHRPTSMVRQVGTFRSPSGDTTIRTDQGDLVPQTVCQYMGWGPRQHPIFKIRHRSPSGLSFRTSTTYCACRHNIASKKAQIEKMLEMDMIEEAALE